MPERLWVISELYYPEETSTGYYLTRIAEGLARHYPTHVLCGQPNYAAREIRAPASEFHAGVNIRRCAATRLNRNILLFKLINHLSLTLSIFLQALFHIRRHDTALVVTNPPMVSFLVAAACRLRGVRCVLLIHDLYPDLLIAVGKLRPHSALARLLKGLNGWLYRSVGRVVVIGRDMEALISRRIGHDSDRVVFIPNWAELDQVVPERRDQNRWLRELGLERKFVLQYAGNMGYPNDLESILESASRLRENEEIHFLFMGTGSRKRWLEEWLKAHRLPNVTVLPYRPRSDQSCFLNACDAALIALVAGMRGVSMPSRTYNTLAAGKPIIGIVDAGSELAQVIQEETVGWVVPPGRPDQLVEAIQEARAAPARLCEMGQRARSAAESKYGFEQALQAYLSVIRSLDDGDP